MAMRTATPWWASLLFGVGLFLLLVGERTLGDGSARLLFTGVGTLLVLGTTGLRAYAMLASRDARRRVERTLLVCQLGALVALLLYALTTPTGQGLIGMGALTGKGELRYQGAMTVLWLVVMLASIVPLAMIELSLGTARREALSLGPPASGGDEAVEYLRVREIGWSGLTVAFAVAFAMVTCRVAEERNVSKDVSYFKTSAPGESTIKITQSLPEPLKVLLFFPSVNEVKDEVRTYFSTLAGATGKVQLEEHDRLVSADLATKYRVNKDGVVVLTRGDKSETLELDVDFKRARAAFRTNTTLRNLDREVNTRLLKLVRERRKAYLTVGHGEINDPSSIDRAVPFEVPPRQVQVFRRRLADLGYEVKNLGLIDLARDVPEDATVVIVLGPVQPLLATELDALDRYLAKGGRLLIAMDPKSLATLGTLEGRLGFRFDSASLTDKDRYLRLRGTNADRRVAITTQFSSHASTTALSRMSEAGLPLVDSGALFEIDFAPEVGAEKPKKTVVIRSAETSWLDRNNNYELDDKPAAGQAAEKRDRYNVAAAIEGPKRKGADGKEQEGFRAMLYADADLFADAVVDAGFGQRALVMIGGPILEDAVRWLGGEEFFAGEVVTEEDKPIQHSKDQEKRWFLLIIVGLPLAVLGLGLTATMTRRRRKKAAPAREVTP